MPPPDEHEREQAEHRLEKGAEAVRTVRAALRLAGWLGETMDPSLPWRLGFLVGVVPALLIIWISGPSRSQSPVVASRRSTPLSVGIELACCSFVMIMAAKSSFSGASAATPRAAAGAAGPTNATSRR